MEYKELSKLYHMDKSSSRDKAAAKELDARRNAESAFLTGFDTPNGELFFTIPRELSVLSERVLRTERKVSNLLRTLPGIAQSAVLRSMVLDEVVCTNAIEDIHSTRRQIKDALDAAQSSGAEAKRFKELATLYLSIIDGVRELPESPADIRVIYDKVTAGEIPPDKIPDGQYFRKEGVDITAGGVRVIHHGLEPESRIIEAMEKMLALTKDESLPALYSAIASHYIFEYAHPFYDGNGRTGRYLLSLFLSEPLSVPTALSLSRTIAEHKDTYYRAFMTVEDKLNHAELTFFIYSMLELIRTAQLGIIERLETSVKTLDDLKGTMAKITSEIDLKDKEAQIVFLLLQYEAFGLFGDVSVQEIASFLRVGKQQARKYIASLEDKGICRKLNSYNPVTFGLTEEYSPDHTS